MTVTESHGSIATWAPLTAAPNPWRDEAACKGQTFLFFDDACTDMALALCAVCPVREPCLEDALTRNDECVQGGMTWHMRKAEKRRRARGEGRTNYAKQCPICAKRFISTQHRAKFCSEACKSASHRRRWREDKRTRRSA